MLFRFGRNILVDAGRGVIMRLIGAMCPPPLVTEVLLTHLHSDHICDLNDVVTTRWVASPAATPLDVYGPPGTARMVDGLLAMLALDFGAGRLLLGQPLFTPHKLLISLLRVRFTLLDRTELPVQIFFALDQPLLRYRQFRQFDFLFFFQIGLGLENQILRLKFGFLDQRLRFALGVLGDLLRLIFRFRSLGCGQLTANHFEETGTDQRPDESAQDVGNE